MHTWSGSVDIRGATFNNQGDTHRCRFEACGEHSGTEGRRANLVRDLETPLPIIPRRRTRMQAVCKLNRICENLASAGLG